MASPIGGVAHLDEIALKMTMYELGAAVTRAINSLAGASSPLDFPMVWSSGIGVPVLALGTRYASDVLGGTLTGIAAAMLVLALYREETRADRLITGIL